MFIFEFYLYFRETCFREAIASLGAAGVPVAAGGSLCTHLPEVPEVALVPIRQPG